MEKQARRALGESGRRPSAQIAGNVVSRTQMAPLSRARAVENRRPVRTQYTWALSIDQTARPISPDMSAMQASDSTSDAASAKAEDGGARVRGRDAEPIVGVRATSRRAKWFSARWPEASKSSTPRARDGWCFWAQKGLDARPHPRSLPCGRGERSSDGRDTGDRALTSTQSLIRMCGCAPLSTSSCIAPIAMAAQRAATFKTTVIVARLGTRLAGEEERSWKAARAATCALSEASSARSRSRSSRSTRSSSRTIALSDGVGETFGGEAFGGRVGSN
eukprot:6167747-Pleurochrysis_carterae.AAC.2